ncbi:MAG: ribonuclease III [Acetobacter sp.]|nr:ribonuclease III [Acetobacter sp.]
MQELEEKLGYTFQNKDLLERALTHASFTSDIHRNYERLEFLGDRILGVTIAEMLSNAFPDEPEGNLAQRFVRLVCKNAVADVMRELNVSRFIIAGAPDVRKGAGVLCDVGEAIIAAIYLDSGCMETAQAFVRRNWEGLIDQRSHPRKDYKTYLQEKSAHLKLPMPVYKLVKQSGPAHAPDFIVSVSLGEEHYAEGTGSNKKKAEQEAAATMLIHLGVIDV